MDASICWAAIISILFSAAAISPAAASSISAGARGLLQAPKSCPVDFETMNYTVITSKCRAPEYNKTTCCDGFRDFACPLAQQVNDLTTVCASAMFSYINAKGNYPGGLFQLCLTSRDGIDCPPPPPPANGGGAADIAPAAGSLVLALVGSMLFVG